MTALVAWVLAACSSAPTAPEPPPETVAFTFAWPAGQAEVFVAHKTADLKDGVEVGAVPTRVRGLVTTASFPAGTAITYDWSPVRGRDPLAARGERWSAPIAAQLQEAGVRPTFVVDADAQRVLVADHPRIAEAIDGVVADKGRIRRRGQPLGSLGDRAQARNLDQTLLGGTARLAAATDAIVHLGLPLHGVSLTTGIDHVTERAGTMALTDAAVTTRIVWRLQGRVPCPGEDPDADPRCAHVQAEVLSDEDARLAGLRDLAARVGGTVERATMDDVIDLVVEPDTLRPHRARFATTSRMVLTDGSATTHDVGDVREEVWQWTWAEPAPAPPTPQPPG